MALLLTVLVVFVINGLTEVVFEEEELASNAFPVEMEVAVKDVVDVVAAPQGPSLGVLLAGASAEKGQTVFKKCKACHTTGNGGKNLVGPNLWNVVGRVKGSHDGYAYSSAMKDKGGEWIYEDLDAFLKNPGKFVTKTKMSFAGLKKSGDRAAVIVFLRSLSEAPADLPVVEAPVEAVPEE